jgi:hypothetical protein
MENTTQKNTVDTHPWFKTEIDNAKKRMQREKRKKEEEKNEEKKNDKIEILWMIALYTAVSYLTNEQHLLLFIRLPVLLFYYLSIYKLPPLLIDEDFGINDEDIQLYMRFTRPGLFYKHTHYIFDGTKRQLEKALQRLDKEVEQFKMENQDSRDPHDRYIDTPLDTFCSTTCGCNKEENEYCSQWLLYNYPSYNELYNDVENIGQINEGFPNEINYTF